MLRAVLIVSVLWVVSCTSTVPVTELLVRYGTQLKRTVQQLGNHTTSYPAKTLPNDNHQYTWGYSSGWTSGFYPGILWQWYNHTGDSTYLQLAQRWTAGRESEAGNTGTHDIGFMVFGSFGWGMKLGLGGLPTTTQEHYKAVIARAAHSLAERYNPVVGMTRSWGSIKDDKKFEVIIDNLMNLELFFWASEQPGGDPKWKDMAVSHALKTCEWWIRPDGSTYHLVVFDPKTGDVLSRTGTPQGYSANSTWARGQAWGVYGFTLAYRYTHDARFLTCAQNVTEFWRKAVPKDLVPYWDFNITNTTERYKDTSAAAITASGLLELSHYIQGERGVEYHQLALDTMKSLASQPEYLTDPAQSLAMLWRNRHDCASEQCTVIETDFYFLEALRRIAANGSVP